MAPDVQGSKARRSDGLNGHSERLPYSMVHGSRQQMTVESQGFDPYDAVLADLRAKREQIDQAIQIIEAVRGGAGASPAVGPNTPQGGGIDGPGAFLGMTIPDAAKSLLAARRRPLNNADIVAALKGGGLHMNSVDPINTVGSVLMRRFNQVGDIVRVGRGVWGLAEWYPNRSFKKKGAKADAPEAETPKGEGEEKGSKGGKVSFMITQAQRGKLREMGMSDDEIGKMTPQQAHDLLELL